MYYMAMTDIDARMLDRELKKGSAELLILSLLEARPRDVSMAYVCRAYRCLTPTDEPESFRQQLQI